MGCRRFQVMPMRRQDGGVSLARDFVAGVLSFPYQELDNGVGRVLPRNCDNAFVN
jgi:hypothetical protein